MIYNALSRGWRTHQDWPQSREINRIAEKLGKNGRYARQWVSRCASNFSTPLEGTRSGFAIRRAPLNFNAFLCGEPAEQAGNSTGMCGSTKGGA